MAPRLPSELFAFNKKPKVLSGDVIQVLVGNEEQRFTVHENSLRVNSAFFEAALRRDWMETVDRTVKLPEESPERFHVYVQWVYCGLYKGLKGRPELSPNDLARLYTLGARLQDHDFQDAALDAFIYRCGEKETIPDDNIVFLIFSNTTKGDPMRRLLVKMRVRSGMVGNFDNEMGTQMAEFYFDIAKKSMEGVDPSVAPDGPGRCKYHQHGDQPCYRADE
ncbi:hypothetical protein PRZ48_011502 [Zasmidium cellare]|uniref:BTB domain-containing protein n=1 Tax=Zasmidium cellare TaxID=395010 RepID=A0ABR0E7I4_ZASCE|nr:hypothetical protein PRZ48_011502 [Zasmidium cellare]